MEENLTNFVNLLNRQRQRPPVPPELSGLPNWAQRELAKLPEMAPPTEAQPTNGIKHEAEPKSEIVVEAKRADVPSPAQSPGVAVPPPTPKPAVEVLPPAPLVEILPPAATVTAPPAATKIDPKRDPEAWLARFLAEEGASRKPIPPQPAAEKSEPAEKKIAAADKAETAAASGQKIEILREPAPGMADAAEIVPLQPVIAEALASPRAGGRRPTAYALAAAAVVAAVALVVGAYWYTYSEPELTASTRPAPPAAARVKPPPALAKNALKPVPPAQKTAATKPAVPAPKMAAAKPVSPSQKMAAAKPAVTAPTTVAKPADKPKPETTVAPAPSPAAKPAPAVAKPATPVMALAQKMPEKPQATNAAKPGPAPAAPVVATAPKSAPPASTQIAMLPGAAPSAVNPPAAPATTAPVPAQPPATVTTSADEPTWRRNAIPAPPFSGQPQIAIVIDDLGLDRGRTERAIALDGPVTLSFLAYASDLPNQTAAARKAGHELIVHVPMEPIVKPKYVSQTAGANPAHAELVRRLRWDLSRFTGYVGINNHMGNSLSSDADSAQAVIAELKTRGLLFLDSHVAGAALLKVAAREGVPAVTRDVLLDDDVTASSVTDRLADLETIARLHGTAIAIGHPHDRTLDALKVWIASLPAKGLQLVPLTAVVRDREQHVAGGAG